MTVETAIHRVNLLCTEGVELNVLTAQDFLKIVSKLCCLVVILDLEQSVKKHKVTRSEIAMPARLNDESSFEITIFPRLVLQLLENRVANWIRKQS